MNIHTIYVHIDIDLYSQIEENISTYEEKLLNEFKFLIRDDEHNSFCNLIIKPVINQKIIWSNLNGIITKTDLMNLVEQIKSTMVSVSTGGPKINTVNEEYKKQYRKLKAILAKTDIENTNPYDDLWKWYGKWSDDSLPSYSSRRLFLNEMFNPLLSIINESTDKDTNIHHYELTGWKKVDRSVNEMRKIISYAENEEQFQSIGLIGRETLISLAQEVYDSELHTTAGGEIPSKADANRMLDAFISTELQGKKNEIIRRQVKSTLALANYLTHKRTATNEDASLCIISVMSLVNTIKIVKKEAEIHF